MFQVMTEPPTATWAGRSVGGVVNRDDVREFLATRRARITPHDVGLPTHGANRRVPGLRREEVAVLAGVSIDYYTRLERGNLTGVSDSVLEAVARALLLDEAERAHLLDLARTANNTSTTRRRRPSEQQVRPGMQRLLDAMTAAPTLVRNGRLDVIATNPLGRALFVTGVRRPGDPDEPGPVHVRRPDSPRVLRRLGRRRQRHRRHPAHRSRTRPRRPQPHRPHR